MNAPILRDKQEKSARPARNLLGTILDSRHKEAALAVVAAWLAFILANSEGVWWGNALNKAEVEKSPLASTFLELFLPK